MNDPVIRPIPLDRLERSPANVRRTEAGQTAFAELKASIAAHGLLENLVARSIGPGEDGGEHYAVIAGARRLAALNDLAKDGVLSADHPVPCRVIDNGAADSELSLAENVVRVAMHPADQVQAFGTLANDGASVSDSRRGLARQTPAAPTRKPGRRTSPRPRPPLAPRRQEHVWRWRGRPDGAARERQPRAARWPPFARPCDRSLPMLDAHPAPAAPARPPAAAVPAPSTPAPIAPRPAIPSKPSALLAAARTLLPVLETGRPLDARVLREAMTRAFGASDADGAWVWKDAYEAAEAALVLFLQRYGRAMRREAGAGPEGPAAMLRMLEILAALEPSQTRRSEEQLRLQQFSTPLPLAYAALQAAAIRPGDVVLEPSAGTGMLAVMAHCALGAQAAGALHLNELAATRAGLLSGLFPGCAVMEVVARDLKALGLYQARALSYDGVEVDILEHPLSDEQRRIYDAYAGAFKVIHRNIEDALKATGIMEGDATLNKNAKAAALSAFEGAKQRFFGHLLTAMKCPSLIRAIEAELDAGHACVIQLVSTGEALLDRRIAEIPVSEWEDISVDLTPREACLEYLAHAFPVQLQEPFTDDEGNLMSRPVTDAEGNPVLCQEAVAARDSLIEKLAALPPVQAALDQILHRFGDEAVAEVTGRSRRVLRIADASSERLALRNRPASANLAETAAFMAGDKRILVFSMAGGTGRSYHADLGCGNTARRIHYLLEPGWRADQAIQGLGRTHRTHQASAPLFRPVTTDVKGERRFIATIARRLDSLGAITRGQRDSQTAMGGGDATLFRASDNLESPYAKVALRQFYIALWRGNIAGWSMDRFEDATGLKLIWEGSLKEDLPPMPRFLNCLTSAPLGRIEVIA